MTRADDNIFRYILSEINELSKWLEENKKFEPRSVKYAVHRYYDSRKAQVAGLAAKYVGEQETLEVQNQRAQDAVAEYLAELGNRPTEILTHEVPGLPGAIILKTDQGALQLIWYDAQSGQVVSL